ncbi:MAG: hypothetical protein M1820_000552 [Bogoriella megaspora]|nr:MAG: hypothetical protein M1820_000552 [Bogoriella megaspora]
MDPWSSWVTFIAVAGGVGYYYFGHRLQNRPQRPPPQTANTGLQFRGTQRREENKPKKKIDNPVKKGESGGEESATPTEAFTSGRDEQALKQRNRTNASGLQPSADTTARHTVEDKEEDTDVKNWAANLAKVQKGSSLAPPTKSNQRQKTVRQSAAANPQAFSTASSTTPADADDELSDAASPALQATSAGIDISDMLEAPAPGPSTLRFTESDQFKVPKTQRQPSPMKPQETKKQRQNRKKTEAKKAEREEAEKERRVLEEKQRRLARESRGEPAKNGITPANAPATSAWESGAISSPVPAAEPSAAPKAEDQLLDTFEQDTTGSTTSSNDRAASPDSKTTAGTDWNGGNIPSEEEQIRMLQENDDATWNTVPTGKKNKKKTTSQNNQVANGGLSDSSMTAPQTFRTNGDSKAGKPIANGKSSGSYSALESISDSAGSSRHPGDSDWSVV